MATAAVTDEDRAAAADQVHEGASAFLDISASDLAAALFLAARAGTAVEVRAENGSLHADRSPLPALILDNVTFVCRISRGGQVVLETTLIVAAELPYYGQPGTRWPPSRRSAR